MTDLPGAFGARSLSQNLIDPLVSAVLDAGLQQAGPRFFAVKREGNIGVLGVTARPSEASLYTTVSCQIGVVSARLAELFGPTLAVAYPEELKQHWYRAWGYISPEEQGAHVFDLRADDEAATHNAIRQLRDLVLPALFGRLTDRGLRDDWLKYEDDWLTPVAQQSYLAVLLTALGPKAELSMAEGRLNDLLRTEGWATPGVQFLRNGLERSGLSLDILR